MAPLYAAATAGDTVEAAEIARERGAAALLERFEGGVTALHAAVANERPGFVAWLLRQEGCAALLDAPDDRKRTPLNVAALYGCPLAASALLAAGAGGAAAAAVEAARLGRAGLVELLLRHATEDPAAKLPPRGWTPHSKLEAWTHQELVAQIFAWSRGEHPVQLEARAVAAACAAAGRLPKVLEDLCVAYTRVPCDDARVLKHLEGGSHAVPLAGLAEQAATLDAAMLADEELLSRMEAATQRCSARKNRLRLSKGTARPNSMTLTRLLSSYELMEEKSAWVDSHGADHHHYYLGGIDYLFMGDEHEDGFRGGNGEPSTVALLLPPDTFESDDDFHECLREMLA